MNPGPSRPISRGNQERRRHSGISAQDSAKQLNGDQYIVNGDVNISNTQITHNPKKRPQPSSTSSSNNPNTQTQLAEPSDQDDRIQAEQSSSSSSQERGSRRRKKRRHGYNYEKNKYLKKLSQFLVNDLQGCLLYMDDSETDSSVVSKQSEKYHLIRQSSKELYNCLYGQCSLPRHVMEIDLNAVSKSIYPPVVSFRFSFKVEKAAGLEHRSGALWLDAESSSGHVYPDISRAIGDCMLCIYRDAIMGQIPRDIGYLLPENAGGGSEWVHQLMFLSEFPHDEQYRRNLGVLIARYKNWEMDDVEKLKLSVQLAEAVLKFDSCLLTGAWSVQDVICYHFNNTEINIEHFFLRFNDWSHIQSDGLKIKRRSIYSLGVALMEVFTWQESPKLRNRGNLPEIENELQNARTKLHPYIFEIIQQCINTDLGHSNDGFENYDIFYKKVVFRLQEKLAESLKKQGPQPKLDDQSVTIS